MPIYEYECSSCHHQFDLMQKISDVPVTQCPNCFENKAVRLISAAGFQLKGTGWYVTDFKNKGAAPTSDKNKADKTETKVSSTTKKDE